VLEIPLTWVSGCRHPHRGRDNAPFIRSITHAPDQTYIRHQHLHCLFDLAISPPFRIIAWIKTIFMDFRGLKALVNLHGCRQHGNNMSASSFWAVLNSDPFCHQSPWRETRGSNGLRFDRKAAIFLITGEILLHFSSTFILMGAPRLMTSGRLSLLCADT
jgi:hypothetical protein